MIRKPVIDPKDYESGFARFDSLMQYRVKDILLVSSLYDSFILEEDGQIAQLISSEYAEHNLTFAPQIKRVSSGEEALRLLEQKKFDLIMVFRKLSDINIISFGLRAKEIDPDIPIVLLAFNPRELAIRQDPNYERAIDKAFIWNGESDILLAIAKFVEDRKNVDNDTRLVGVRVIILIEDSVRFYSAYLPLIYTEIVEQTQALMSESLNKPDKLLRMRARPKILLAETFEEGWQLFKKYRQFLLGIISDVSFFRNDIMDKEAGLKLAEAIKKEIPDLPILLQSSNRKYAEMAREKKVAFLYKNARTLLTDLRNFIMLNFGFGDFVFRLTDGTEVDRAENYHEMERCLETVPEESLIHHGNRNHFSNWLMARTEFDLAVRLRPRKVTEFNDIASMRQYLMDTFRTFRHEKQLGMVSDFSRRQFDLQTDFVKIGNGSLGGKGRGLAFINRLLRRYNVYDIFEGVRITVPPSFIVGTSVFDKFLEKNNLLKFALGDHSDDEIAAAFVNGKLPKETSDDLKAILEVIKYPLAVRSSSLLEDSHYQPFAGIYETHMLPNRHRTLGGRLSRLEEAIKYIYASTFFKKSKNYIETTGNRVEEEKMAVILQKVVGSLRRGSFYPVISGIARSYNFYSIGHIKPEEGIAYAALGLGRTIVEGGDCLYFSPSNPMVLPQFSTTKDFFKNSQHDFFAIDMSNPAVHPSPDGGSGLMQFKIDRAVEDGSMGFVGSTYSRENDRVYDGINRKGVKLVTFAPILKNRIFPLDEIIRFLLRLGSNGMNFPVEIEFAAELHADSKIPDEFGFLQIRPMAVEAAHESISLTDLDHDRIICRSDDCLSHGRINDIQDIIYVRPDTFDRARMSEMAVEVGRFNELMKAGQRPYLLIGPGRWGTADRWLGIPAKWDQISSARVIIEAAYGDFSVTPSFGTHFFQNLISFQIGYLTVNRTNELNFIDWNWLESLPVSQETGNLRHVRLARPLEVIINGHDGQAVILRPADQ
nr:histidine kinase [candidate division Zixibacteria bacterium]